MTTPRDLSQVGPPTPPPPRGRRAEGRAPRVVDGPARAQPAHARGARRPALPRRRADDVRERRRDPEEARYRLIRLDNQSFHRRVWDVEGGRDVCHALGWHHVPADADGQGAVVVLPKECATTTTLPTPSPRSLGSSESPAPTTTATADFSLVETKRQPKTLIPSPRPPVLLFTPPRVVIPESAVSLIQSMINEHAAIARREHAAAPTPTDPDAADVRRPPSPSVPRRPADPFGGAGAARRRARLAPRRYLADLRERRARRDEERERVLSRVEDDRRFGGGEEEEEESDGPGAAFSFSGARAPWCTAGEARGDGVWFFRTRRGAAPARRRIPRLRRHSHVDESFAERLAAEAERERYADAAPLVPVASESIAQGAGGGAT